MAAPRVREVAREGYLYPRGSKYFASKKVY